MVSKHWFWSICLTLQVMVRGLEDECAARLAGATFAASASGPSPPPSLDASGNPSGVAGTYSTPNSAAALAARSAAQVDRWHKLHMRISTFMMCQWSVG